MARPVRRKSEFYSWEITVKVEEENYYHIYNRGNNRQKIFLEEENYLFFLNKLHSFFDPPGAEILAYCLMPNHFHLLVYPQKQIDFGNLMRSFSNSYVRSFNNRYRRSGHLYEDDYQPKLVDSEEYLTHLCRYIHLNPVKASLVNLPEDWLFSDYKQWISSSDNVTLRQALRDKLFGSAASYKEFVMNFEAERRVENKLEQYLFG